MRRRALFRLGLRGLLLHKLRSTLSILGVVFGVAAVVAMSSVGEGARREALEQLGALGVDSITVRAPGPPPRPAGYRPRAGCGCGTRSRWPGWCRTWSPPPRC